MNNYSDINNINRSLFLNKTQSSYISTIFTPSIINSILNEKENTNKNDDNNSNISNFNLIIENINKNQKTNRNLLMYKTPENKNIISNGSENGKNSISSSELFLNEKNNKINNSIKNKKTNNNTSNNYNNNKTKYQNKNKYSKEKLSYLEFSSETNKKSIKNRRQQNEKKK